MAKDFKIGSSTEAVDLSVVNGSITSNGTNVSLEGHTHSESDISGLTSALSGKQATLVSGTNIKTINNQSIVGSGNITIGGSGDDIEFPIYSPESGSSIDLQDNYVDLSSGLVEVALLGEEDKLVLSASTIVDGLDHEISVSGHTHTKSEITDFPEITGGGSTVQIKTWTSSDIT